MGILYHETSRNFPVQAETGDRMRILIAEDDEALCEELSGFLEKWGYETAAVQRFDRIDEEFAVFMPQLVLMDVNLPYYDGFYWCARLRRLSKAPILFISSRSDDRDKIMAIAQGADDYVEKPFRLELLRAKIEAALRRAYEYRMQEQIYVRPGLFFEGLTGALFYEGKEIALTKSEKRVLQKLFACRPAVVSREELMNELWNTDEYVSDGTLTTLMSRLRSKLKKACKETLIHTRKGEGYQIP